MSVEYSAELYVIYRALFVKNRIASLILTYLIEIMTAKKKLTISRKKKSSNRIFISLESGNCCIRL